MEAKICGVKDELTLRYILNHSNSPRFIGFIINYKKSKRFIELAYIQWIEINKKT